MGGGATWPSCVRASPFQPVCPPATAKASLLVVQLGAFAPSFLTIWNPLPPGLPCLSSDVSLFTGLLSGQIALLNAAPTSQHMEPDGLGIKVSSAA